MNRATKTAGSILALGTLLVVFNLGGSAGCGSGAGGGGGGGGSSTATASEEATSAQIASSIVAASSSASSAAGLRVAGLKLESDACISVSIIDDDTISITFDNCVFEDVTMDGTVTLSSTSETSGSITYDDVTVSGLCGTFSLDGTVSINDDQLTIDIDASGEGETISISGTVTANDDETISGDLSFSGSTDIDCEFDNTEVTCPGISEACGFSADDVCDGNDFDADVCEELDSGEGA